MFRIFTTNMYTIIVLMCSIGFLDLKNIGVDTKIMTIGVLWTDLLAKTCFRGGHFEFSNFGREPLEWRRGSRNFWNQHTQLPPRANFHASYQKCTPKSHIRPTTPHNILATYMLKLYETRNGRLCIFLTRIHTLYRLICPCNTSVFQLKTGALFLLIRLIIIIPVFIFLTPVWWIYWLIHWLIGGFYVVSC